jgi:hypothetical protein
VVSSDLADTPFFGIYKLSWSVSQPHNLRVKYSYHSGECQLKTLKLKWDAPYIQVQAEVEGFSWQHTSNLEPEKQLLERIERVKEVTDNRVDETPTASREVMKLTTASDIKGNLGREVLVEGIAGNASLGAVVLFGDTPIYLEKLKEWQSKVAGKRVRASGILQRFEVPTSRQDEYGNWSAGVSTGSYKLVDVKWAVIQP